MALFNLVKRSLFAEYMLIVLIVAFSCKSNRDNKEHQQSANHDTRVIEMPYPYGSDFRIDEVFSKLIVIPLDGLKECQLRFPVKIMNYEDKFLVLDFQKGLYVFSNQGKYLNKIGTLGKGPGELLEYNDYDIDSDGNIVILDFDGIYKYDINGVYLGNLMKFDFRDRDGIYCNPYQLSAVNHKEFFLWSGTMGINSVVKNHFAMYRMVNGKLQDGYFPLKYKLTDEQHRFIRCGDKVLINPVIGNDTIFSIQNGKINADYFVKFKNGINHELIPKMPASRAEYILQMRNDVKVSDEIKNPLETNDWLTFAFTNNNKRIITFYNKISNHIYTTDGYSFGKYDSKDNFMPYYFMFVVANGFGSIINSSDFNKIFRDIDIANFDIPIEYAGSKDVNDNDNDVILIYQLKDK